MKNLGLILLALITLLLAYLLYKLMGPWVFAGFILLGLLSRLKK